MKAGVRSKVRGGVRRQINDNKGSLSLLSPGRGVPTMRGNKNEHGANWVCCRRKSNPSRQAGK
jgi:acetyltransferase-like isoleucine patch superfamily enzyme